MINILVSVLTILSVVVLAVYNYVMYMDKDGKFEKHKTSISNVHTVALVVLILTSLYYIIK